MKLAKTIFAFLFFVTIAKASTFVGNGGNAGDVELQVTITQLTKTLTDIANRGEDHEGKLCKCEKVLNSHKICDSLQALNQRQVYYCGDTLSKNASDIVKLIQSKEGVQVVWTSERIDVLEKNGERQADAVAQQNGKLGSKIYLNKEQFLSLTDYERIFLITA